MIAYRCATDWARVLALLNPAADALLMEDVLFVTFQLGYDVILTVLDEANRALFVGLAALPKLIQRTVLYTTQAA